MKIVFPALVFYVNKIKSDATGVTHGIANGFVIRIVKSYANDVGLLAHELCHVRRFWLRGGIIHLLLYKYVPRYRLSIECEAYAYQWLASVYSDDLRNKYINAIDRCYGLNYSIGMIEKVFDGYIFHINHG
jgi:hypothetical protein